MSIDSYAFEFKHPSNVDLWIALDHNELNGNSFGYNAFPIVNRNTYLDLRSNPLKYLSEEVFHIFLENHSNGKNIIYLSGTPLDYYKQNQWLLTYRTELNLTDKLLYAKTVDRKDFWQTKASDYTKTL